MPASMAGTVTNPTRTLSYFFYGNRYTQYRWATDSVEAVGSLPLFLWRVPPAFQEGIDAACNGAGRFAPYAYLFKGPRYVRYAWDSDTCDYGVDKPASLAAEWNLSDHFAGGIDAALPGQGRHAAYLYFFRGDRYSRYNWVSGTVDREASIADWKLPAPFGAGVDAAVNGEGPSAGKAYFIRGDRFIRYDWSRNAVEDLALPLGHNWPALLPPGAPRRTVMLYVTFDAILGPDPENREAHAPNLGGLRRIATATDPGLIVSQFWCPNVTFRMLQDDHLLALFLAGSWTEWATYFSNPAWARMLDAWVARLKATDVPIFAACGSHQLLAYAYGGWSAVGHMSGSGATLPIAAERTRGLRPPDPRWHEQGLFSVDRTAADPILEGLPERMTFVEYHADEVVDAALPPGTVTRLATGQRLDGCYQDMAEPQRQLRQDRQRSRAQLLRYTVPPAGRLLYSSQFHPELGTAQPLQWTAASPVLSASALACSQTLLGQFLAGAKLYWEQAVNHQPVEAGQAGPAPGTEPPDLAGLRHPVLRRPGAVMG